MKTYVKDWWFLKISQAKTRFSKCKIWSKKRKLLRRESPYSSRQVVTGTPNQSVALLMKSSSALRWLISRNEPWWSKISSKAFQVRDLLLRNKVLVTPSMMTMSQFVRLWRISKSLMKVIHSHQWADSMTTLPRHRATMTVVILLSKALARVAQLVWLIGRLVWWLNRTIACLKVNRVERAMLGLSTTAATRVPLYINAVPQVIVRNELKMACPTPAHRVSTIWSTATAPRSKVQWPMSLSARKRKVPAVIILARACPIITNRWTMLAVCQDLYSITRMDWSTLRAIINHPCLTQAKRWAIPLCRGATIDPMDLKVTRTLKLAPQQTGCRSKRQRWVRRGTGVKSQVGSTLKM